MTLPRSAVRILPAGPLHGQLAAPASKSMTNRVLAIAALASGRSFLREPLDSDDAEAMRTVVSALGASVTVQPEGWLVSGSDGQFVPRRAELDARLSGTTMRFATGLSTMASKPVTLTGLGPLLRRPIGPLVTALRALGADIDDTDGYPPVHCRGGGLRGGSVRIDAGGSSQYVSAVLLAAPYADTAVHLVAEGLGARAYVDLTVAAMREWGAAVEALQGDEWRVQPGGYTARTCTVEYDASAACHLFGLAAATGGSVTVTNANRDTLQPDAAFVAVLAAMGARVSRTAGHVSVAGPDRLHPVEVDLRTMPDQVTTLAALAALADGPTVISGVGVVRGHETDRLSAIATELGKLAVRVDERPDGLVVHGGDPRGPARLATYDDHRLAMAFAALAAAVPDVTIDEPWCVAKTYPRFWDDARRLGLDWEEVASTSASS